MQSVPGCILAKEKQNKTLWSSNIVPSHFTSLHAVSATRYSHQFLFLFISQVLVQSAVNGILMGLGLTLPLLIIMTTNWIVALMCCLTISLITVGVIGIIPLAGWKLGILESLNLTLVVGLAVDYVVHLADGYVRSQKHSRGDRVRDTLGHVGISVLSGACTTIGASIFMLFARILFFFQFGIFMFCTIGLSIFYALFFFTTVLALVGPEGNTGSILPLMHHVRDKLRGKKTNDITCQKCDGRGFHAPYPPTVTPVIPVTPVSPDNPDTPVSSNVPMAMS